MTYSIVAEPLACGVTVRAELADRPAGAKNRRCGHFAKVQGVQAVVANMCIQTVWVMVFCASMCGQTVDPAWIRKKDLPEPRIFELAVTISDRIYAVTSGEEGRSGTEVHVYHPQSDTWVKKSHANLLRHSFGGAALGGRIYIWGGAVGGKVVAPTEVYDRATDTWTIRADMARPRLFAKGAAAAGKLYAVGGIVPPGRNTARWLDEYDPTINRWTLRADLPSKRDAFRVAATDSAVYVVGNLGGEPEVLEYRPGH
jgi:hypothetical protein